MYSVKQRGKSGLALFQPDMQLAAVTRLQLEHDLHQAVRNNELHLVYQPIVDLRSGRLSGVEALVRWQNETRGLVSPADFVPVAESAGLIVPLGEWVLTAAAAQLHQWNAQFPDCPVVLSVNVSIPGSWNGTDCCPRSTACSAPDCRRLN